MTKPGYKQTPEHIAKRAMWGARNPSWKGEQATAKSGRSRALRLFRNPPPCEKCGEPSERHHKDSNPVHNEAANIQFLCTRCHMELDGRTVMGHFRPSTNLAGYRCVFLHGGKYRSIITVQGKRYTSDRFATAEEAALAYNVMARKLIGPNAILNTVEIGEGN